MSKKGCALDVLDCEHAECVTFIRCDVLEVVNHVNRAKTEARNKGNSGETPAQQPEEAYGEE